MIDRTRQGDLLDLAPLGQGEGGWAAAGIAWVQGVEPVQVEVVQHIADPVVAGEGALRHQAWGAASQSCGAVSLPCDAAVCGSSCRR